MPKRTNKVTFDTSDEIVQDPQQLVDSLNNPHITGNTNTDLPISMESVYQNPFTVGADDRENPALGIKHIQLGDVRGEQQAGFAESAKEDFKEWSTNYKLLNAGYGYLDQKTFSQQDTSPDWTPTLQPSDYVDIPQQYQGYLANAKNPQDLEYRKQWIQEQIHHDDVINNGSFFGKLAGGALGALTPIGSIENMIPLGVFAKYTKAGSTALKAMARTAPAMTAAALIRSGANEVNKIDGNLQDFVFNTFVDATVGTALFGVGGAVATGLDKIALKKLGDFMKAGLKDINFDWKVDEKGAVSGFKAIAGNSSVSAAEVDLAQNMADSAFYKGGIFKIPVIGDATLRLISGQLPWSDNVPVLGAANSAWNYVMASPLVQMVTSKYAAVQAFANLGFDHFITTEGVAKGGSSPFSFEHFMKRERAGLKAMFVQVDALHIERNGLKAPARPLRGLWNAGLAFRNKSLEKISSDVSATDYVSPEHFMDEIQNVLWSKEASPHASVNEAAAMFREKIDTTWAAFRKAYKLPDNWMPSRTAESYLMRVYDTNYLNTADGERAWLEVIPKYLKEADQVIETRMAPIRDLEQQIKDFELKNEAAVYELGTIREKYPEIEMGITPEKIKNNLLVKASMQTMELSALRQKLRGLKEQLQNELRTNPDLHIHVDDMTALSADEGKELYQLLKPLNDAKREVSQHEQFIKELQSARNKQLANTKATSTIEKAKPKAEEFVEKDVELQNAQEQLRILNDKVFTIEDELQAKAQNGELNPRFYKKIEGSERYEFKNPTDRLKFRDTYESDFHRQAAAKGYYQSIMNMHPEDIIADVMGKMTGNKSENVLRSRSLIIPDSVLYKNNFMTKDLKAKTANYVNYLARRTHLKNVFQDVTIDGGFDEVAKGLLKEHEFRRSTIQAGVDNLTSKLKDESDPEKIVSLKADLAKQKKEFSREVKDFNTAKELMKRAYESRIMGIKKRESWESPLRTSYMALVAATNLHNLPATQITDLAAIGFQHGLMGFIKDGIYPIIESLGGILKTKDSEALRKLAPQLHLGMNDYLMGASEKQWGQELQPYLNMGKIVSGLEKYAQFSANTDLSTYIDNGIQHVSGSVIQGNFMRILHEFEAGTMSAKDGLYLRKYGIDPKVWAKRMVAAYKDAEGYQTAVGGYQSMFWKWQDLEASNLFANAVFKGINNTLIMRGLGDSPFLADNILGMIAHTFTGWGYASVNRYLIPALQHPDASLIARTMLMLSAGALVSPLRRLSRGEEMWPDNMSDTQFAYEAINDSGVFSNFANSLNYINMLSGDKLMGDLKNDKYRQRMGVGLGTVGESTLNRMYNVLAMFSSRDLNEKDLNTLAKMLPITGAMYGHQISKTVIDGLGYPSTRGQAEAIKEFQ